jgi:hypothetical protein
MKKKKRFLGFKKKKKKKRFLGFKVLGFIGFRV